MEDSNEDVFFNEKRNQHAWGVRGVADPTEEGAEERRIKRGPGLNNDRN